MTLTTVVAEIWLTMLLLLLQRLVVDLCCSRDLVDDVVAKIRFGNVAVVAEIRFELLLLLLLQTTRSRRCGLWAGDPGRRDTGRTVSR